MSETPAEPIKTLPLVMEEPRGRKKPPRHLADLTAAERKALLEEQGLPGFRAKQLSTHYFARLVDDPEQMTDLPAGQRADLVGALLPELMTPLRTMEADKGTRTLRVRISVQARAVSTCVVSVITTSSQPLRRSRRRSRSFCLCAFLL